MFVNRKTLKNRLRNLVINNQLSQRSLSFFQILSLLIIGWISTTGQLHEGNRRKQKRLAALAMFLGFIISIVNVIITSFTGYNLT